MNSEINLLKGLHPGVVLARKLDEKQIPRGRFAMLINEYPQTLSAIIKGRRAMNTHLALRVERELGLEEGYFMILQVFHEIKVQKEALQQPNQPRLSRLRTVLFWDTNIKKIDWVKQKRAVIERVFERGNAVEKDEIVRFYGKDEVEKVVKRKI